MASTNNNSAVATRFLRVRLNAGLSQQAFADALGISLRGEQNYERGVRKLTADVLLAIARIYRIDPLWILEGPEERPRKLISDSGIDRAVLARAIRIVTIAVADSGKNIDDESFSDLVVAIYEFLIDNVSGAGVENLLKSLVGARR